MRLVDLNTVCQRRYDIAVIGAGAAGLAVTHAAETAGLSVVLLERGGLIDEPDSSIADITPDTPHDPMAMTTSRGVGGTWSRWGGRCVPFDRADFAGQPDIRGHWPIEYEDYARWIGPAAAFLGVEPEFDIPAPPGWPELDGIRVDTVERLSPVRDLTGLRQQLQTGTDGADVVLEIAAAGFIWSGPRVTGVEVVCRNRRETIKAGRVVLAGGGLHSTRLLLSENERRPRLFSGAAMLGRGYMGHLTGSIADIRFARAGDVRHFAYHRNGATSAARRRILATPSDGLHIALWAEALPFADPAHRSGELSFKALASGVRGNRKAHIANMLADPIGVGAGLVSGLRTRLTPGIRHPSRLLGGATAPYRLAYHAEHLPHVESRVTLASTLDRDGAKRLQIDFAYGEATLRGVVAAHRRLAAALAAAGLATVTLDREDDDGLMQRVVGQARDGYHQIGLTRMADHPNDGVVDANCRVHGTENLFVAAASVFPVSSQANPTLSIVAFALRLADHLTDLARHKAVT